MKNISAILALAILLTVGLACSDAGDTTTKTTNDNQTTAAKKDDAAKNDSVKPDAANGEGVHIAWVKLYTDDGSGDEGDEVQNFKPTDNPQHFTAHMSEFESGTRVKLVVTAVNAGGEKNFKILEKEVETNSVTNQTTFMMKLPRPFPTGDYRADFYVNDKLDKTVNYKVQ